MNFDLGSIWDSVKDGTKEVAETAHEKTSIFHKAYVSKVLPDCGKYGNVSKFAAEMAPGVSEYNAIVDGDWTAFAVAAGIDIGAIAVGAFTAGAGYTAFKGGSTAAKTGVKVATKEIAEVGTKKAVKEVSEVGTEKMMKEVAEDTSEKVAKKIVDKSEILDKVSQIEINKRDGIAREEKVLKELVSKFGDDKVIREALLRDANGKPIIDSVTKEARRIDFVIRKGEKIVESIEVTSETAPKALQIAKEMRILDQAKNIGGAFIKDPNTGELIKFGEKIVTEIRRLP